MKTTCILCPHACRLAPGQDGRCRARGNRDGRIECLSYGRLCAEAVDPIEKKPLFHFLPGTTIYSIATPGCNLRCVHCQNWSISQPGETSPATVTRWPTDVAAQAVRLGCPAVAYTYTEPLVSLDYVRDCCQAVRAAGRRNVLVTAAYIRPEPLHTLLPLVDAANVDLKAFSDRFYREICGATLAPVLQALEQMRAAGLWLEITNLVIPGLNDADAALRGLSRWVYRRLGAETPLHFSRFFPNHRMRQRPPTPPETLRRARDIARGEGLRHVYLGNLPEADGTDTDCASCGARLIERPGGRVPRLRLRQGCCPDCGTAAAGVWNENHDPTATEGGVSYPPHVDVPRELGSMEGND